MNKVVLLLSVAVIHLGLSINDVFLKIDRNENLIAQKVPCLYLICQKYFKSEKRIQGSLVILYITPNGSLFQRKLMQSLSENRNYEWALMAKHSGRKHANASHVQEKAKNYLFLLKNSTELFAVLAQAKSLPTWNPYAQVMVLLLDEMEESKLNYQIMSTFEILRLDGAMNVNIMYSILGQPIIETKTWSPYGNGNCADTVKKAIVVDRCKYDSDNISLNDLGTTVQKYPKHFNQCPLRISTLVWAPFTILKPGLKEFRTGIEIEMIKTIGELLSLRVILIYNNQTRSNKVNGPEFYTSLLDNTADIMIGGNDENPNTRKLLTASIPYYQDDLTWCVSKSGLASRWSNVFAIFSVTTWIVTIFSINVTGLILYLFVKYEKNRRVNLAWGILITFSISFNNPGYYYPKRVFTRIFFITVVFYGLNFYAAYQSFLISVLTNPRYDPQISSLQWAIEEKYELAGGINVLTYYKKDDGISRAVQANYKICSSIEVCLQRMKINKQLAVAVSRKRASGVFDLDRDIYCFPRRDNVYSFSIAMFSRKSYHLMPFINDKIRRILESGLIRKWDKDVALSKIQLEKERLKNREQVTSEKPGNSDDDITLTIEHVQGAFIIWGVGLIVSALRFVYELIKFNYRKVNCKVSKNK